MAYQTNMHRTRKKKN